MNTRDNRKQSTSVLVTRPAHQSDAFITLLQANGFRVIRLPTIDIQYEDTDLEKALRSDLIIFTSVNAVTGADRCRPMPWNTGAKVAAIGHATEQALLNHQIPVDIVPRSGASTESLLQEIDSVNNLDVTIVRGDSGREALYNALKDRGATVGYECVYRRTLPGYSNAEIERVFADGQPDIVSITSDLGLQNLMHVLPTSLKSSVLGQPLVVNSERCATLARDAGFHATILVANPPGDRAQLNAMLTLPTPE